MELKSIAASFAAAAAAIGAAIDASAATVAVSESTASTATLAFADHAGARLGLYIAYDAEDRGASTNGWASVEYVGAVEPDTDTLTVALPSGWGTGDRMAARFFLSEVPYPVDCTLDYIQSTGTQYMVPCSEHTPTGASVVEMDVELTSVSGTVALFCARGGTSGSSAKQFTLFVTGGRWRFDYNGATGGSLSPTATPTANTRYALRASSAGFYIGDSLVQERPSNEFTTACGGRLLIMGHANGTENPSSVSANKMKLYGFRLSDGSFALDLVPAVKDGVAGMYDTESRRFIVSAGSGAFVAGTRQQTSANPIIAASGVLAAAEATELLFTSDSDVVDATDYRTALPGRKIGAGNLSFSGDSVFTNGFQVGNGKWILAEGSSFASTNHVYVGSGNGADSCGHIVISNATFDIGSRWLYANAGANKGDNNTRILIYGDDTVVRVGRFSISKGELQIYGGVVTAIDETANPPYYGVALGSGNEACRLYGGTLVSQCVRFSGASAAFEWRGGTFKACATVNGSFFQTISGMTSPITKTRVGREGGAFDTAGYTVRITNNLVRLSGESPSAYDRSTSMAVPAFAKRGAGTLVFAGANTYVCATEIAEGTLRLETAALPADGLVRLAGGTLAFHNNDAAISQTIGNLVGTGAIASTGRAAGSALSVAGEIVPGGPDGSLGPISVNGVALSGGVVLRVAASGAIPSRIVNAGESALDVSALSFTVLDAANLPTDQSRVVLVEGPVTGTPSVSGLPEGWVVKADARGLSARAGGFVVTIR